MTRETQTRPHPQAKAERADRFLSPRVLTREAAKLNSELDLRIHPGRLRTLMRHFVAEGRRFDELGAWLLAYADPTGETAARNVDRERT